MKGVGHDIIEIERIRKILEHHPTSFYEKILTEKERAYCLQHQDPTLSLAGRFCAKEAIAKALGTGFGKWVSFLDLEILNNEKGAPHLTCSPALNERFSNPHILLSITHCASYAAAVAIWVA